MVGWCKRQRTEKCSTSYISLNVNIRCGGQGEDVRHHFDRSAKWRGQVIGWHVEIIRWGHGYTCQGEGCWDHKETWRVKKWGGGSGGRGRAGFKSLRFGTALYAFLVMLFLCNSPHFCPKNNFLFWERDKCLRDVWQFW